MTTFCRITKKCDVYVYGGKNGYTIHTPYGGDLPQLQEECEGLLTLEAKLLEMRLEGYKVPDKVFDKIATELETLYLGL